MDYSALRKWWREVDSNHRRRKPADLQSAPVGRLGIPPDFVAAISCIHRGGRWMTRPVHGARRSGRAASRRAPGTHTDTKNPAMFDDTRVSAFLTTKTAYFCGLPAASQPFPCGPTRMSIQVRRAPLTSRAPFRLLRPHPVRRRGATSLAQYGHISSHFCHNPGGTRVADRIRVADTLDGTPFASAVTDPVWDRAPKPFQQRWGRHR